MSQAAWLRLTLTPGIGGETQRKLLAAFGLPEAIFTASRSAIAGVIGDKATSLLLDTDNDDAVTAALAWAKQENCHLLNLSDPLYPQSLLQIPDPPTLLYIRGRPELFHQPCLAIVGSRNATPQGCQTARAFAKSLADCGFTIVSGLALGIDAAAHQGALESGNPNSSTIAVIGTGADRLYPARNKALAQSIIEKGVIISEFPLGTPAMAANFPRRNRLIAGLARGVLVVEATLQSGSLITARLAGEQGREVFAIPGSIHTPLSKGCHQLIRQGAKLVETANDILEELGGLPQPALSAPPAKEKEEDPLLLALGHDPCSLDELSQRSGWSTEQLLPRLLELELSGQLACLPGNRFQRLLIAR